MTNGAVATRSAQAPTSRVAPSIRASAPGRRRRGRRAAVAAFALIVGLPTLISAFYYGLIASPIYVSEASLVVRASKQQASGLLENLVAVTEGNAGQGETQLVADYLQSRDILGRIEADVGFRRRYAVYDADFLSRLDPDASREAAHDYFKRVLSVRDDGAGLLTVIVRGFSATDAKEVAEAAIAAAEEMVNRLSDKAQEDSLKSARTEVAAAERRLATASDAVMAYQKQSGDIDPRKSAEAILGVVAGLETELAAARIRRAEIASYLQPTSPAINALDSKIGALRRQIEVERRRLAASNDETLAEELRAFEGERLELELAEAAFKSALASQEAARLAAQNDRSYLVAYDPPSTPDVAAEPRRLYKILTTFVVSLLAFGVGSLIFGAVREHARA